MMLPTPKTMPQKSQRFDSQRGFTLIELLIALAVMAIFALLAYRGLNSVLLLHHGAYAHEQQAQAIDRVITQFEADVRQASRVHAVISKPTTSTDTEPRVSIRLIRRVDGQAATIEWVWSGAQLTRTAQFNAAAAAGTDLSAGTSTDTGTNNPQTVQTVQTAVLLNGVSALQWRQHLSSADNPTTQWVTIAPAALLAQPNQQLALGRGLGLNLTVAGRSIEKMFLMGR